MKNRAERVIGIERHRLMTDGEGVTTLVAFHGCPLRCKFCLNPHSLDGAERFEALTPHQVYQRTRIDELYFLATGGGVTFGGGEPALHPDFICSFRTFCGDAWHITLETSLNVASSNILKLLPVVDSFIIDIKDMNPEVYEQYTGRTPDLLFKNLKLIADAGRQGDCTIRLPLIPGFNTDKDREDSRCKLIELGFTKFDLLTYQIRTRDYGTRKGNM